MTIRIQPYRLASESSKELSRALGVLRTTDLQVRKHRDFGTIINWGNPTRQFNGRYINNPEAVRVAGSKLETAIVLDNAGVSQPAFTTELGQARTWLLEGGAVMERHLLRASQGRGLRHVDPDGVLQRAPLYTRYVRKADEFRVHVFDGQVIDVQQKRKRRDVPNDDVNYQIRNARYGWVFCRDGVQAPDSILNAAIAAVAALGLDFGAVDIGYNRQRSMPYVFEVNTAPGLEGTTLDSYVMAFNRKLPALAGGAYRRRRG